MNINKTGIPIKLNPDNLVDAVVEFRIVTNYNAPAIEHKILDSIACNYPNTKFRKFPFSGKNADKYYFANDTFRFFVSNDIISFNIVGIYPGWNVYNDFLRNSFRLLCDGQEAMKFCQVRLNYVSHLKNVSIFKIWDGQPIHLNNIPNFHGQEFNFQYGIYRTKDSQLMANTQVKLTDNLPIKDTSNTFSRIDIALESIWTDTFWEEIHKQLQFIHDQEKEIFFRLLSEEFVNSLNPQWK